MFARVAILIVVTAFLAGCGNKPSGIYHAANSDHINLFTKLNFTSGSNLELTGMDGSITEATDVEDGDRPKVTAEGGDPNVHDQ